MEKRGKVSQLLMQNILYLILLVVAFAALSGFVGQQGEGAAFYEDFYAKEIARIIDLAEPGDEIVLDVRKATEIARKNGVPFEGIFMFDNSNKKVVVRLSTRRTNFNWFNDVSIVEGRIERAIPINVLKFKVVKGGSASA